MKKMIRKILIGLLPLLLLAGCKKDENIHDEPDLSQKNIYQNLTENGNYTLFLEGIKIAGYENLLKAKKEAVFVPNDEAFRRYMTKKGITSLQDFNPDSLKMLVGYHLLNFLSNPDDFSVFDQATSAGNAGCCYKFRTFAQAKPKEVTDPQTRRTVKVYQLAKYLPVISTNLLREQESSNFEGDYKLFFPSIKWQGDQNKLYVANAAVIGERIAASNGYIFQVDEVVEPLATVYDALAAQRPGVSFNIFRRLYDRFAYMEYDSWHTRNNTESSDSLFNFYHYLPPTTGIDLSDIAYEWTDADNETEPEAHLKYAFNCFVPTDQVLEPYIKNFFSIENIEDVPLLNLFYFLKNHCPQHSTLVLPSLTDKGITGESGEKWELRRSNILAVQFCSNGVFYGVDKLFEPAEFTILTKPFFQYPRFSTMLNVGHKQGAFKELTNPEGVYTIFAVSDTELKEKYGLQVDYYGNLANNDILNGRVVIKGMNFPKSGEIPATKEGVIKTDKEQKEFINGQIVRGYVDPWAEENLGKRVFYPIMNPYHFIYTEYGQIFGEDQQPIELFNTWSFTYPNGSGKGLVYEINAKLSAGSKDDLRKIPSVGEVLAENYQKFYSAIEKAGLSNLTDGKRCMVFAPTDDVWDETKLPTDAQKRINFLKYFFVPVAENNLTNYTLPGFGKTGEFETCCTNGFNGKVKMTILFANDKQLMIKNPNGTEALTDESVPYFAGDGVVFGVTSFITPE